MTPLQRLIEEHRLAFLDRHWYDLAAFERKAKAEIKAMGEAARRSIGQTVRYSRARINGDIQ